MGDRVLRCLWEEEERYRLWNLTAQVPLTHGHVKILQVSHWNRILTNNILNKTKNGCIKRDRQIPMEFENNMS